MVQKGGNMLKRNLIKILIPLAVVAVLAGIVPALPALAAPTRTALHTVQGIVVEPQPTDSTFTIQSSNNVTTTISVNATTKCYLISIGRVQNYIDNQVNKDIRQDKDKDSRGAAMKELHIPANWRDNLGWLDTFNKAASFSDIALGDRIIARVDSNNMASQVLIIEAPVIRQVKGQVTISSSPDTVVVNPTNGQTVSLSWDTNTEFIIKGTISAVGTFPYGVVTYNAKSSTALLVNLAAKAPTTP
jgi:hypothetical protein